VDPKKIGVIESCDLQLIPTDDEKPGLPRGCPRCKLRKVEQSLDVMLFKRHSNLSVIVATVDAGYVDFAVNWACSLRRLGIDNYLFHAFDDNVFKALQDMDLPVVKFLSQLSSEYTASANTDAVVYGSVSYQSIMNTRTEFVTKVIQKGYHMLLSDVDIVFLRNPFPFFNSSLDLQGGAHKDTKITGGFVYTRATQNSYKLWTKLVFQHRELFTTIQGGQEFDIHTHTEQELLNKALLASTPEQILWGRVPKQIVADGKRFFIDKETQKGGEWPALVHANYIIGADNKRTRFQNVSLWLIDEHLTCKGFPNNLPGPPSPDEPRITLKILTFSRPLSLALLLDSLSEAHIPSHRQDIPLDIFIDFPEPEVENNLTLASQRSQCIGIAQDFKWKYGEKRVVVRTKHFGLAGQWLNSWFPESASEVAMILEDDNIVSPHFFTWLTEALRHYYSDPHSHDPRLIGIALNNQHMIAGRYPKKPSEFLPDNVALYKYQLPSTWGPVIFGTHWANFLTWYAHHSEEPAFQPVFSNLNTNKWFFWPGEEASLSGALADPVLCRAGTLHSLHQLPWGGGPCGKQS